MHSEADRLEQEMTKEAAEEDSAPNKAKIAPTTKPNEAAVEENPSKSVDTLDVELSTGINLVVLSWSSNPGKEFGFEEITNTPSPQ